MTTIASLTFDLVANSAKLQADLKKAGGEVTNWASRTHKSIVKNQKAIGLFGSAVAGAVVLMAKQTGKANQELINNANIAGESFETFNKLRLATSLYGIEQDKLADVLKDTNDKIGDFAATGGGALVDFFDNIAPKVGLTIENFQGLSGSQGLQLYYDALEKANVNQQEMTFYMEAIASDATALIPLLKDGGAGFREMGEEAELLGLALDDVDAAQIQEMNKQFIKGEQVMKGLSTQIGLQVAPLVSALADSFLDAAKGAGGMGNIATTALEIMLKPIKFIADGVRALHIGFTGLGTVIAGMTSVALKFLFAIPNAVYAVADALGAEWDYDSSVFGQIENGVNTMYDALAEKTGELLMEPLPSQQIDEFVNEAAKNARKAARLEAERNKPALTDTFFGRPGEAKKQAEKEAKEAAKAATKAAQEEARKRRREEQEQRRKDREAARKQREADRQAKKNEPVDYTKDLATFEEAMARYQSVSVNTAMYVEDAFVRAGDAMVNNFSNAAATAIVQGKSMSEVWDQVANTLATSVISSLIQIGVQMAINKAFGTAANAQAIAEAGVTGPAIATAFAPAAAAVSLATQGANSIPAAAGIASAYGMTSKLAVLGMAHEGMDNIPREGTWLLDKGERVIPSDQNERIVKALEGNQGGAANDAIQITNVFQFQGSDGAAARREMMKALPAIESRITQSIETKMRSGRSMSRAAGVR